MRDRDIIFVQNHSKEEYFVMVTLYSVSARISKGQSSVSAKKGNLHHSMEKRKKIRKTYRISLLLGSIKCFPISFTHLRQFRWLPDGTGIIMTNNKGPLAVKAFLFSRNTKTHLSPVKSLRRAIDGSLKIYTCKL
jgi:hypothetical protein